MNKDELKAKYGKKRVPHQWRKTDIVSTLVCTFLGSGMSPKAPGTMGSLAAAIVSYPMALGFAHVSAIHLAHNLNAGFLAAALIVFFAAIPFVNKAMKDTETEDPGWIVIDEVVGIFATFAFIPCEAILFYPWLLLVGFGLFRFFDILKPLGIHKAEALPNAWGVMADDLLGGIYSGILMATLFFFVII